MTIRQFRTQAAAAREARERAADPRYAMLARLSGDTAGALDQSELYRAGLTQLQTEAQRAAAADAGDFARRGMAGGEAELAARAMRGQQMAGALTGLTAQAGQERMNRLQMLAGLTGQMEQEKLQKRQIRSQEKAALWGSVGNLLGSAIGAFAGRPRTA